MIKPSLKATRMQYLLFDILKAIGLPDAFMSFLFKVCSVHYLSK